MENEVLEKLEVFLQNLRCEDIQRTSLVQLESCKRERNKLENLQNGYDSLLDSIKPSEKIILNDYVDQIQNVAFAEQQEAYMQGMIDAFQILCGIGMLSTNEKVKTTIEKLKNDFSKNR